ncbi:Arv1-like family-domain-containing protein [Ephemerocybe angulata]|uniref:Protein ARV n=1 Tax=Ephemerocybe angulata TaxID=980116 RepID=A0A8H6I6I3_9AGAR|nr:Arv1-like family-domain-containing protein [Tulosesus angulatus]
MPICTSCTSATEYLYTTYESEYNLRLEQCSNCKAFVDPYVEFDTLNLFIDLILLKRGVYRHLLYNRGTEPRRLGKLQEEKSQKEATYGSTGDGREKRRWVLIGKLGSGLIFLDAFIRWSYLNPTSSGDPVIWTADMLNAFGLVLVGTAAETLAFHVGIMLACYLVLKLIDIFHKWRVPTHPMSPVRQEFRLSLIPLTLFYSSLTKYFLLLLLTIWLPASSSRTPATPQPLPTWTEHVFPGNEVVQAAFRMLDDDKLDREWVVRNVLGGMSAGFGLRVILDDVQPIFTTLIIVFGWAAKTLVAQTVSNWIGVDEKLKEAWLAYSIP